MCEMGSHSSLHAGICGGFRHRELIQYRGLIFKGTDK
jgi:hypothetical protein